MKSILEELFHENVCPDTDCRGSSEQTKLLQEHVARQHHDLYHSLTEKQKPLLDEFDRSDTELIAIHEQEVFVYAFRLGMRIAIEVLLPI